MSENAYENFRTVLAMNLCASLQDPEVLQSVLAAVDLSISGFEVKRTPMELIPASGCPDVLKLYLASKAVSNCSMGTLKQYQQKISNFLRDVRKSYVDVQPNDIRLYLYQYKEKHHSTDTYIENIRITINTFFSWLHENEYIHRNPCAKVEKIHCKQAQRKSLSTLSLEFLRWNCANVREKALVDFLYSTGCRVSECAGVLLDDIDWNNNSVLIRHGKGNKERTVYFNDESKVTLQEYIKSRNDDTPALWVSQKAPHQQLHTRGVQCIISDIGKRAGVHLYPHLLRHTFATLGLRNGMSLDKLQALLGHASPKTTLIYAQQNDLQLQIEHSKVFS